MQAFAKKSLHRHSGLDPESIYHTWLRIGFAMTPLDSGSSLGFTLNNYREGKEMSCQVTLRTSTLKIKSAFGGIPIEETPARP